MKEYSKEDGKEFGFSDIVSVFKECDDLAKSIKGLVTNLYGNLVGHLPIEKQEEFETKSVSLLKDLHLKMLFMRDTLTLINDYLQKIVKIF